MNINASENQETNIQGVFRAKGKGQLPRRPYSGRMRLRKRPFRITLWYENESPINESVVRRNAVDFRSNMANANYEHLKEAKKTWGKYLHFAVLPRLLPGFKQFQLCGVKLPCWWQFFHSAQRRMRLIWWHYWTLFWVLYMTINKGKRDDDCDHSVGENDCEQWELKQDKVGSLLEDLLDRKQHYRDSGILSFRDKAWCVPRLRMREWIS